MKKIGKVTLRLNKESIRTLSRTETEQAVGGISLLFVCETKNTCDDGCGTGGCTTNQVGCP